MKFVKRLDKLEKQIQSEEEGTGRIAIKYNGGEISWNNKIYNDDVSFHAAVESYYKNVPSPVQGPRVLMIRFWRDFRLNPESNLFLYY